MAEPFHNDALIALGTDGDRWPEDLASAIRPLGRSREGELSQRDFVITSKQLQRWVSDAQQAAQRGQLPVYVPHLAQVNPAWFAVQIQTLGGLSWTVGDSVQPFPFMSVVKPFVLLRLLEHLGFEQVFAAVGMQPSDQPFHSLEQLRTDGGFPRNPMINSGAIALAALLPGADAIDRCQQLQHWLNDRARCALTLDEAVLASVRSRPNDRNRAIARELERTGHLTTSAAIALDTYERICCLSGTVVDLAKLGMLLVQPNTAIPAQFSRWVNAIMLTCGLYEYSGPFAVEVGLPTKSGVSGAVLSIVPGGGAIACYSPPLDAVGNSVGSLGLIRSLAQSLNLSAFG